MTITKKLSTLLIAAFCVMPHTLAQNRGKGGESATVRIEVERLPDLNIPRAGHQLFIVNGEPTVVGGHSTNFKPTATAEYFKDGQWHLLPTAFAHDDGVAVPLSSGKVMIAGGHEKNLGIGQSYEVEMYDPATHTFVGLGALDRKRTLFSATEIDSGRVVIAGNWYADDAIELFDADLQFRPVKKTSQMRSRPYILPTSSGDVLIFGSRDTRNNEIDTIVADRLHGSELRLPLFDKWRPLHSLAAGNNCFIGNRAKGDFRSLIPVYDKNGQMAIALITDTVASLLPTTSAVPTEGRQGRILYYYFLTDTKAQRAYLLGTDIQSSKADDEAPQWYVVSIDYAQHPARLTLGITDPLPGTNIGTIALTERGDLLLTGGLSDKSNFKPSTVVYLLHVGSNEDMAATTWSVMTVACIAAAVIAMLCLAVFLMRRQKKVAERTSAPSFPLSPDESITAPPTNEKLMESICTLMEEQQLYLDTELKLADLATSLGTNRTTISNCINSMRQCTFTQFVNTYRIRHAQQLMRDNPDKRASEVWMESGFSNETSFFRTFKTIVGMTPTEWKNRG